MNVTETAGTREKGKGLLSLKPGGNPAVAVLRTGAKVFVQRQALDGSVMFEVEGKAVSITDRIHVHGHGARLNFGKTDVAKCTLEKSTGKVWVYLK